MDVATDAQDSIRFRPILTNPYMEPEPPLQAGDEGTDPADYSADHRTINGPAVRPFAKTFCTFLLAMLFGAFIYLSVCE